MIDFDAASLIEACEKAAVMPESGSRYVPDMPELEALPVFAEVKHTLRGEGGCQIGCCWGYNTRLNCLEYHRASEHNVAVSDLVLLLGRQQDMEGFDLPAGKIKAFFVPKGTTIEVYATTLHFCPCQVSDEGFRCIVDPAPGHQLSPDAGKAPGRRRPSFVGAGQMAHRPSRQQRRGGARRVSGPARREFRYQVLI